MPPQRIDSHRGGGKETRKLSKRSASKGSATAVRVWGIRLTRNLGVFLRVSAGFGTVFTVWLLCSHADMDSITHQEDAQAFRLRPQAKDFIAHPHVGAAQQDAWSQAYQTAKPVARGPRKLQMRTLAPKKPAQKPSPQLLPRLAAAAQPAAAAAAAAAAAELLGRTADSASGTAEAAASATESRVTCTTQLGYANARFPASARELQFADASACMQKCRTDSNCNCWSWKDDGYCRIGKLMPGSCTHVGSSDNERWLFGSCELTAGPPVEDGESPGARRRSDSVSLPGIATGSPTAATPLPAKSKKKARPGAAKMKPRSARRKASKTLVPQACTTLSGYINSLFPDGSLDFSTKDHMVCILKCQEDPHCNCWTWKDDGFCRVGSVQECELVGSQDDDRWLFGTCDRALLAIAASESAGEPEELASKDASAAVAASTPQQISVGPVQKDIHAFYYMWYANKKIDGTWAHWNHPLIPHWDESLRLQYPRGDHNPDVNDIGSTYWPELGPYSSRDPAVVRSHMWQMKDASIGVAVLSWYPPGTEDEHGLFDHQDLLDLLLEEAADVGIEVAIHIEPYKNRSPATVRRDIQGLVDRYGDHPAWHRRKPEGRHLDWLGGDADEVVPLPVIYIYDSYHNTPEEWAGLLTPGGDISIRKTSLDAIVFCLWVERDHESYLAMGGFNGAYTYFASNGMVYGSTITNWAYMAETAAKYRTLFLPSVGPGYNDLQVRPWNTVSTRDRTDGEYYKSMFHEAIRTAPAIISLTSWNEWHEGTNIEPAVPREFGDGTTHHRKYEGYGGTGARTYLNLTADMAAELQEERNRLANTPQPSDSRSAREAAAGAEMDTEPSEGSSSGYAAYYSNYAVEVEADEEDSGGAIERSAEVEYEDALNLPSVGNGVAFAPDISTEFLGKGQGLAEGEYLPIVIMACCRPGYLQRAMESYLDARPDASMFPIWVSQDSSDVGVAALLKSYLDNGDIERHWRFQPNLAPGPAHYPSLYHRLASHYKFALDKVFLEEGADQVIILEDDLEVAPDFYGYFAATLPLLKTDPYLFCVSAWNDNGKSGLATDSRAIFRSDFFPGLGWMLLGSFWAEVRDKWPEAYWDDFVRTPAIRQGRHCIRPEVGRTRTFGEIGASQGQFFSTHLAKIVLNTEHVDWASEDLSYVATAENFDAYLSDKVRKATLTPLNQLLIRLSTLSSSASIAVPYTQASYVSYAQRFGLMEDEKSGITRGSYRGVLTFTWKSRRIYLVRDWPLSSR